MRYPLPPAALLAALFVVLTGGVFGAGQQPPAAQTTPASSSAQQPVFKVGVEYVEVDAVVTDAEGRFVRGLTQDDFLVFEDGRPRDISAFSFVEIPVEGLRQPAESEDPVEPDVSSNERPFDGRIYVMVIDDLHTNFARTARVRAAARQFIQQYLGANDLMAVVHTAGASDAGQELTGNKRLLLAAVDRTNGRKLASETLSRAADARSTASLREPLQFGPDRSEPERQSNARLALDTLRNVADWFATVRGRRKAILFVSEGIDYDIADFGSAGASLIGSSTRDVLAAAARGNASIYGIDPRGLTSLAGETVETALPDTPGAPADPSLRREVFLSQGSLRQLSDETGGFAVVNANDFSTAFDRIVSDSSAYYAMAYYPPTDDAGRFHRIEVRVRRPDLRVRARRGYVSRAPTDTDGARRVESGPGGRGLATPEILDALNSPLPVSGLGLRAFAAPFKGALPDASVLIGVEVRGADLRLEATDKVAVSYVAVDAKGQVRGGSTDSVSMALRPETKSRVAASALRLLNRVDLPPGRYQLRVAAHHSGGSVGSVVYDLDVPDFGKLPFSMSGLVLTSAASLSAPTVRADEALRHVLPGPPVAARSFPQNDELAIFAEVYDNGASKPHKVDITTTVTNDRGTALVTTSETRDSSELQGRRGGYGYSVRFSLKQLAEGTYLLTVAARSRLGDVPGVERRVPFTVTAPRAVSSR